MTTITTPLGEIRLDPDGTRTLRFQREYGYPDDDVWSAVTEPDRLARWIGPYTGTAVAGGRVALTMTTAEDSGGQPETVDIIECEAPRRLVVDIAGPDGSPWRIALTLTGLRDATTLVFEQCLTPEVDPSSVGPGWHWYLDRLSAALAGAEMPSWDDYHPALIDAYRAN